MAVISTNLGDVHEPKPVAPGLYALTIAEAEYREEKNDIRVSIGIDEHLDAPNVTHFISLAKDEDDERKVSFKALMLKRFLTAFGIPHNDTEFDTDDFSGATASLELVLSEPNEAGNVYNRLVLPRIVEEEKPAKGKPGSKAPPPKRGK